MTSYLTSAELSALNTDDNDCIYANDLTYLNNAARRLSNSAYAKAVIHAARYDKTCLPMVVYQTKALHTLAHNRYSN